MSKSLKNFIKIRQALKEHSPRQLRLMFLLQPWHKKMNYSDQTIEEAKTKELTFKNFFGDVKALVRTEWMKLPVGWQNHADDLQLYHVIANTQTKVHEALCDNFDTPVAVSAMVDLCGACNIYLRSADRKPAVLLLQKAAVYITQILRVLGVIVGNEHIGFPLEGGGSKEEIAGPFLDALVEFRDGVRAAARGKDNANQLLLELCDQLRDDKLTRLGVRLKDSADGTTWGMDSAEAMQKEIEAKKQAEASARAAKAANKVKKLQKELDKHRQAAVLPVDLFKTNEQYIAFDDRGIPTELKSGAELSKKLLKKFEKELARHEKAHSKLLALGGVDVPGFLAGLQADIDALTQA